MKQLKPIDYKLLFELMKDSKRSDRQLARVLKVSQPTITRKRANLEKELLDGYTAIPKWEKLGYEIFAITLVKTKTILGLEEKYKAAHEKGTKWLSEQPNVIMGGGCRGMGMDGFFISIHRSYTEFNEFMFQHKRKLGDQVEDVQTILVSLSGKEILKPLHLKYLTEAK